MGQVLHRSATTTQAVRRAIQYSHESMRALALRHGINPKTVAKWRKRCSVADLPRRIESAPFHGAFSRTGSHHRCLSSAHCAGAGRLPLCAPGTIPQLTIQTTNFRNHTPKEALHKSAGRVGIA